MATNISQFLPTETSSVWPTTNDFPVGTINPSKFQLVFPKMPYLQVFCNVVIVPNMNLGTANQSSTFLDLKHPGEKLYYQNLECTFLVDSEMKNFKHIHQWMKKLSVEGYNSDIVTDAKLLINNNTINFYEVFPVSLGSLILDSTATDIQYPSCQVVFAYNNYDIE